MLTFVLMESIYKKHKDWIKLVVSFGVTDYPEDIVQDCYIKCYDMDFINEAYFRKRLFITSMDYHKAKKKNVEIIDDIQTTEDEIIIDVSDILDFLDTWNWFDKLFYLRYIEEKTSLRKFAIKYHYDYGMVYRTLKKCKLKLEQYGKENN